MINKTPLANISYIMKKNKSLKITLFLKRIFNVRDWIDWERVKAGGKYISKGVEGIFVISATRPVETFEEAQARMKLTDSALASRARALLQLSIVLVCLAVLLFVYAIYHFMYGTVHAGILTFSLMLLSMALAFRYHFWYFQIKTRKLGCSFREWFRQGLKGDKP